MGIDIGRVIIDGSSGPGDTSLFSGDTVAMVRTPAVPEGNVRFCLRRPEKAIHCAELGITHFVDDKPDVIAAITPVVPHRYFFKDWKTAEAAVLQDLQRAPASSC